MDGLLQRKNCTAKGIKVKSMGKTILSSLFGFPVKNEKPRKTNLAQP
jgi:hypothetical protein